MDMTQSKHHLHASQPPRPDFQAICGAHVILSMSSPQTQTRSPPQVRDNVTSGQDTTSGQETMDTAMRTFRANCHCRASTVSFTLPRTSLPLPVHFCHCSICRKTHGTLFSIHAPMPSPDVNIKAFASYKRSEHVTKLFCKTCGAHMLDRVEGGEFPKWYIAVSLVDAEEEVWKYTGHHFVEGTGDGGLAIMLREMNGVEMGLWKERRLEDNVCGQAGDWHLSESRVEPDGRGIDRLLRSRCRCGSVDFWIAMPSEEDRPKPLVTKDRSKWLGRHCACDSCRLTTSSFISSWINFPSSALRTKDSKTVAPEELAYLGTRHESAKEVSRTFCNTCGASISYRHEDEPGVVKIAAGLLEGQGARAENCIEWIEGIHSLEDARLHGAAQALAVGMENRSRTVLVSSTR